MLWGSIVHTDHLAFCSVKESFCPFIVFSTIPSQIKTTGDATIINLLHCTHSLYGAKVL